MSATRHLPRLHVRLEGRAALERLLQATGPRTLFVSGASGLRPDTACELILELPESGRRRLSLPAVVRWAMGEERSGLWVELTGDKVKARLQVLLESCPPEAALPPWLALLEEPQLRFDELVEMARQHDAPVEFLSRVCREDDLVQLRPLRKALLLNPSLPDEDLDRLLCTYPRGELLVIAGPSAHPRRVRDRAKLILRRAS